MATAESSLSLELPARSESVMAARHAARALAESAGAATSDVALAVSEAVGNAVIHAFRARPAGRVSLHGELEGDRLVIRVTDDGVGMRPNPTSPGLGLGLSIIGNVADTVEITSSDGGGTQVEMRFRLA